MSVIRFEQVSKQVEGRLVLKQMELDIPFNQSIGLKLSGEESQLFYNLLSGKDLPTSGQIWRDPAIKLTSILQSDGLYLDVTVAAYCQLFQELLGFKGDLLSIAQSFSLLDVWQQPIKELSYDQQQRLHLLRAYLVQPSLLFIQSPLAAMSHLGIELYLNSLNFVRETVPNLIFSSFYVEELLLLDVPIYRYQAEQGLELLDVQAEEAPLNQDVAVVDHQELNRVFKIACKLQDKIVYIQPYEIDYIESINSVSTINVKGESYPTTSTMTELEEKLKIFGFFRCHRSYLVNLQRIQELISYSKNSYTLILKGEAGTTLPLSRSRLDDLRQLIEL